MKENPHDNQYLGRQNKPRRSRYWRTVFMPILAIGVIAAVIWGLEYRTDDGESTSSPVTGEYYGPVNLNTHSIRGIGPQVGMAAPDFLLETIDGGELRLSGQQGHPIVLNFWATWCAPCRWEMPQFISVQDRLEAEGLLVIAVNLQEGVDVIRPYAEDFGIDFPIVLDRNGSVADKYSLLGVPTSYFIDRDGVIRSVFHGPFLNELPEANVQGAIEKDDLMSRIEEILE